MERADRDALDDPSRDPGAEDHQQARDRDAVGRFERAALVDQPHDRQRQRGQAGRDGDAQRQRRLEGLQHQAVQLGATALLVERRQRGQRAVPTACPTNPTGACISVRA